MRAPDRASLAGAATALGSTMTPPARALFVALAFLPAAAAAQWNPQPAEPAAVEPFVEHALDIALDPVAHRDRRYRVTGCLFRGVRVDRAFCDIRRGGNGPSLGDLSVEFDPTDIDGRRRLVETCAAPNAPRVRCAVEILATVRLGGYSETVLSDARVLWP